MPDSAIDHEPEIPETLMRCIQALDDKKAEEIKVIDVGEVSSITDYFVIATGTSTPHLRALGRAVTAVLDELSEPSTISDSQDGTGWVVVDAYSFMIHLFAGETRTFFNLEGLWKDGRDVALDEVLAQDVRG